MTNYYGAPFQTGMNNAIATSGVNNNARGKLRAWESLLLDTGKRNNLVSFKDTKGSTVEVLAPDFSTLFSKAEQSAEFEVFPIEEKDVQGAENAGVSATLPTKEEFVALYADKLKKKQILAYSTSGKPLQALKNISKKAQTALEETGVNIAYMAFGFIHWAEKENPTQVLRAPVLLVPVTIRNDSPLSPYFIRGTDDVLVNPTFSFKLKHEYGVSLPEYDEDEGLDGYWFKLSEVMSKLRWWVDKSCKIGLFSFQKMNMYEDLKENAEQIAKHENVRALLGEGSSFANREQGHGTDLLQLCNVVDADSSQAEAIALAKAGGSFVLQGPPGTGKSQTITNIIAECIGDGKTVLFVSEKMAALNVVYDKLKKAGLEEFCLELHSHKANKRRVIDEFYQTLRLQKSRVADSAEKVLRAKRTAVEKLDGYANELHTIRPNIQKSLYALFELCAQYQGAPDTDFVIYNIQEKGEEYIEQALSLLDAYADFAKTAGEDYHQNAWYGYFPESTAYQSLSTLKSDLAMAGTYARRLEGICEKVATMYATNANSVHHAHALGKLFALGKDSRFITPALFSVAEVERALALAEKLSVLAKDVLERKNALDKKLDGEVYKLDARAFHKRLTRQYNGFFSRLFNKDYRAIINELRLCKKDGKKPTYEEAVSLTSDVGNYQDKVDEFLALDKKTEGIFGKDYEGVTTDFARLQAELEVLRGICLSGVSFGRMARMSAEEFLLNRASFMELAIAFEDSAYLGGEAEARLAQAFDVSDCDPRALPLATLQTKYSACLANIDGLEAWRTFQINLRKMKEMGLRDFVDYAIENNIPSAKITSAYCKAFYRQWADWILHQSPTLMGLPRVAHDEAVQSFKEKDTLHFEINKSKIREVISEKRPELSMVAQGSAISVLLREAEKKRNKKSIRDLLSEIGELALTLKPCFLMSPLSVSTYLSASAQFDVVVFDEASQIFPQDAVGAIYRGKQLIVVGDSKQMPPSNFFTSTLEFDEEDEEEDIVDFESVLDLCSSAFPQRRLRWHYRSKFEPLIAFSNKNFYGNDLVTFPSAKSAGKDLGVEFVYAGGTFDRKSKTNRVEAELVVDMVFDHFQTHPNRSLGVVAFSVSQQSLIERLIYKRRKELPNFEEFFSADQAEPFFVKNLETVQGDERDTILFSVAYAKDAQGRLLMNFGPINREGGERRLNVAFTRAKYNVKLISSMRSTEMDISGSKSEGVRLLREYLDYAENGQVALERALSVSAGAKSGSHFEEEVLAFLTKNGYAVDKQVGCSGYKIDLAVKRPNSSDYVLAIECDGASYHSSKTARDRDRLRQSVLENMGWKFYRIWSTDWFKTPADEQKRLLAAVEKALAEMPAPSEEAPPSSPTKPVNFDEEVEEKPFAFPTYVYADDKTLFAHKKKSLSTLLEEIVAVESPVSEDWVLKRLGGMYKEQENGVSVRSKYKKEVENYGTKWKVTRKNGFLYKKGGRSCMLRVPAEGDTPREIKYIEPQELANGLKVLLSQNLTVEKQGLFKCLAKQLGFSRISDAAQQRMEEGLALLGDEVEFDGNLLSLK